MKTKFYLLVFLLVPFFVRAQQYQAKDILNGVWENKEQGGQIQFFVIEGKYFGKLILIDNVNAKDENNKDKKLRTRKLNGITLVKDLSYSKCKFSGGEIYVPGRGFSVNCAIEWIDKNTIYIIGSKMGISKKVVWKRIVK